MELLKELFRFRRYKISQGRLIRRLTMAGVWVLAATAAWKCTHIDFTWVSRWMTYFAGWNTQLTAAREAANVELAGTLAETIKQFDATFVFVFTYSMAGLVILLGFWFGWRLINWITFADFLISVEAEMAKVSWPSKAELKSSTIVVLIVFLFLAGLLLVYDFGLLTIFKAIGIQ